MFDRLIRRLSRLSKLSGSSAGRRAVSLRRSPIRAVESLEARWAMHSTPLAFGNAPDLSLSYVPDGTSVGDGASSLFARFNQLAPTDIWQAAIERAFQTWASQTNSDIARTTDSGDPLGTPGATHHDARFGDIRIAAAALSPEVMAVAVPSDQAVSGTWVGDVLFNSAANWQSVDQVFAVALHEAGHVFGLAHSADPASPMYDHVASTATQFTPADIAALQSRFGARGPDLNELDQANDTVRDATRIRFTTSSEIYQGETPLIVYGDLRTTADVDYFYVRTLESYSGPLTINLRTEGISLLQPKLSLYKESGDLLGSVAATANYDGQLSFTIDSDPSEDRYLLRIESAAATVLGVGGYSITATYDDRLTTDQATIDRLAGGEYRLLDQQDIAALLVPEADDFFHDDEHADDSIAGAVNLEPSPGFATAVHYSVVGSISDRTDVDRYAFKSADVELGGPSAITISIRSLEAGGLVPRVTLFDRNGLTQQLTVLVNGGGDYVVQLPSAQARKDYSLAVEAANTAGPFATGNYELTIRTGETVTLLDTIAAGPLNAGALSQAQSLYVAKPQLFHFSLEAPTASSADHTLVTTLFDSASRPVWQVAAAPGQTRTASSVLLAPGNYTIATIEVAAGGAVPLSLAYVLRAAAVSEPTGPAVIDPTSDPLYDCPNQSGAFCYPDGTTTTDPYWSTPNATVPPPPTNATAEAFASWMVGDWWSWLWPTAQATTPISSPDVYQTPENASLNISAAAGLLANDDHGAGAVVAVLKTSPAHGQLTLATDGSFVYQPKPDFVGVDQFSYAAYNFANSSATTTVSITVAPNLAGDLNHDGRVGIADLAILQRHLNVASGATYADGDLSFDGAVTRADVRLMLASFGKLEPASAPAPAEASAAQAAAALVARRSDAPPAGSSAALPQRRAPHRAAGSDLRSELSEVVTALARSVVATRRRLGR